MTKFFDIYFLFIQMEDKFPRKLITAVHVVDVTGLEDILQMSIGYHWLHEVMSVDLCTREVPL